MCERNECGIDIKVLSVCLVLMKEEQEEAKKMMNHTVRRAIKVYFWKCERSV